MTDLRPFARLTRLTDGVTLSESTNLLRGTIQRSKNKPATRSITVPLGDPGRGDSDHGFANALLQVSGSPTSADDEAAILCEVSADDGSTFFARFVIDKVVPDLHDNENVLTFSGSSLLSIYGTVGLDRFPARGIALVDLLGGNPTGAIEGTIIPKDARHYGISTDGKIPVLSGLFAPVNWPGLEPGAVPGPGNAIWHPATVEAKIGMTPVVSNDLESTLAFASMNIDAWEDSILREMTSVVKLIAGIVFSGDDVDQGSRGQYVECDADCTLARDIQGVVCDGSATDPAEMGNAAGAYGYSNASTNPDYFVAGAGASATPVLGSGAVVGYTSLVGGSNYFFPPLVRVTGDGTGARYVAEVDNDAQVILLRKIDGGSGYTTAAFVFESASSVPNALVIGNVGGSPLPCDVTPFHFDGTATGTQNPALEQIAAMISPEDTTTTPDTSMLCNEIRPVGSSSNAGLIDGAVITSIITLNNVPLDDDLIDWRNVLPLIGTNNGDETGQLMLWIGDGIFHPVPSYTLALPIYDMAVDTLDHRLFVATSQGVWMHPATDLSWSLATPWVQIGGLSQKVTRLTGWADETHYILYALVSGVSPEADAVYQYNVTTPSSQVGVGYDNWTRIVHKEGLIDMAPVSGSAVFVLDKVDSGKTLMLYNLTDEDAPIVTWDLGDYGQGVHLDRVLTAGGQDSLWISCAGAAQPGAYLLKASGFIGQDLQPIDKNIGTNADGALDTAVGESTGTNTEPQINRFVQLGYTIHGVTVSVMLCTNAGIYYMAGDIPDDGGDNWSGQGNGMNGLAGETINNVVAGQATKVPNPYRPQDGADETHGVLTSRMYAISGQTFYYSYSDGRYWRDALKEPIHLGPAFFDAYTAVIPFDTPSYAVQTFGPMGAPPVDSPSDPLSHVINTTVEPYILPAGYYIRRRWNMCLEPYYALINSLIPFPTQNPEQMTEIAVSPSLGVLDASRQILAKSIAILAQRSQKTTMLTVASTFTTRESGLLYLWPTHISAYSQTGQVKAISDSGDAVGTIFVNCDHALFYVMDHTISWEGPLWSASTVLCTTLREAPQTSGDLIVGIVTKQRWAITHGLRTKRG